MAILLIVKPFSLVGKHILRGQKAVFYKIQHTAGETYLHKKIDKSEQLDLMDAKVPNPRQRGTRPILLTQ